MFTQRMGKVQHFYSFKNDQMLSNCNIVCEDHTLFCFHGAGLFFLKEVLNRAGIPTQLFMCIWSLNLIKTTFNSPEPDKDYCRSSGPNKLHRVRQYYGLGLLSWSWCSRVHQSGVLDAGPLCCSCAAQLSCCNAILQLDWLICTALDADLRDCHGLCYS